MKKLICLFLALTCSFSCCFFISCVRFGNDRGITIVDSVGDEISLPQNIERVVSTSEPCTDMMLALGQGDKIVGAYFRTLNNPWFKEFCKNYDNITSFDSYEPEVEALIALNTDIIFVPSKERAQALREKGVCAICIRFYTPNEILFSVNLLGDIFGERAQTKAQEWIKEFNNATTYTDGKLKEANVSNRPVAYEILADKDRGPFRTYYGDNQAWLSYAGGILATKDFANATSSAMPTEEAILATNPDIIFIGGVYAQKEYISLLNNDKWANINAVKNKNIYIEPVGALAWNSCSTCYPLLVYYCFSCMYPNLMDFDLKAYAHTFYEKYYEIDFSEDKINKMFSSLSPNGGNLWE